MNVIQEIDRINAREFAAGIFGGVTNGSWHDKYKGSAWVYVGGLSYELSEGDIICVMSQWGEVEDINVVRDKATGKSQGFAFVKYEDQRSTVLAVDNFNGTKLLGRTLRCDHVDQYKLPKEVREKAEQLLDENPDADVRVGPGHAYQSKELANEYSVEQGLNLWSTVSSSNKRSQDFDNSDFSDEDDSVLSYNDGQDKLLSRDDRSGKKKEKKDKKEKHKKEKKAKKHKSDRDDDRHSRKEKKTVGKEIN
jgi:RNA-binding motif X-linked protein 2